RAILPNISIIPWYHLLSPTIILTAHSQLTLSRSRSRSRRRWSSLRLPKLFQNLLLQTLRLSQTSPPSLNLPIPSHQPLLKIPLNPLHAQQSRFLLLQPLKKRISTITINFRLPKNRKSDTVVD